MIKSAGEMLKALRKGTFCGVVLYEGASVLNGAPIVAIANRITRATNNGKTGDMVQTFILRADMSPMSAARSGLDDAICGDCPHRRASMGSCYVNLARGPNGTFDAFQRGRYAKPGADYDRAILPDLFAGVAFRMGSYGDPCAVPFQIWRAATLKAAAINGYTHQWKNERFRVFQSLCMASADSESDMNAARLDGWRTFRVREKGESLTKGEVACPASAEMGKRTDCASCRACGGHSAKARASIAIMAHGYVAKRFHAVA